MAGVSLHSGPERPLCDAVEVQPGLLWGPQDVGAERVGDTCQGELQTKYGTGPGERSALHSTKLKGIGAL